MRDPPAPKLDEKWPCNERGHATHPAIKSPTLLRFSEFENKE
jgi:hypothetical protein